MDYLLIMASVIGNCCTLMLTGRLFSHINSEIEVTWQEDAQASGVIVGLTLLASMVVQFLGLPSILIMGIYFYLIYQAFQLEGLGDIFIFYLLHGAIGFIVGWLGLAPIVLLFVK